MSVHAAIHTPSFTSAKTKAPIAVANIFVQSALVWASLEKSILSVECKSITRSSPAGPIEYITFEREDDRLVLDLRETRRPADIGARARDERTWRAFCWRPLTLLTEEVGREARFVNARQIWRHRDVDAPTDLRMQILAILAEDAPLTLHEILRRVRAKRDPLPVVFSMACANELSIDLDGTLGPRSVVRGRP